jgi:hypothetical protein
MKILSSITLQRLTTTIFLLFVVDNTINNNVVTAQVGSCNFCVSPKVVTKPGELVNSDILQLLGIKDVITCIELDRILKFGLTPKRLCSIFQSASQIKSTCGCMAPPTKAPVPTTSTPTNAPVPIKVMGGMMSDKMEKSMKKRRI